MFRILTRGQIIYFIYQALQSSFTFLLMFFSIRFLNVDNFGEFSYAYSLIPLFTIIPLTLIYLPLINFYPRKDFKNKYLAQKSIINFFLALILSLLLCLTLFFTQTIIDNILFFTVFFFLYLIYEFGRRAVMVKQKMNYLCATELLKLFLLIFFIILVILFENFNLKNLIFVLVLSILITILFLYKNLSIQRLDLKYVNSFKNESYNFGKWILISNLIQNLGSNFFIYISVILLTSEEIALINAPKIILGLSTITLLAIDNYYSVKISNKIAKNRAQIVKEFFKMVNELKYFFIIIFLVSVIIILAQDNISYVVFGEQYSNKQNFIWCFVLVGFIFTLTRPFMVIYKVFDRTKVIFRSSLIMFSFSILASFPMLYYFGPIGGLTVMIVSSFLQFAYFLIYFIYNDFRLSS